jgi:hypothetical protein
VSIFGAVGREVQGKRIRRSNSFPGTAGCRESRFYGRLKDHAGIAANLGKPDGVPNRLGDAHSY